ncbi:IS30 family transposase [Methanobrevibacter sp.]|uniref:IS30 family transposase n=1 Tax=Methanobrevibacter sp. TaxID=66852 RepID=UPI0025DF2F1C|nr:IS30 family transposase [Methanobrevibacter sp.]
MEKPPYVCTGCPSIKSCLKNHAYYTAIRADAAAHKELSSSRRGFHTTPEELKRIGEVISPLIKRGQSLNHIYATHRDEIGVSERTLYNYIDSSVFLVRNADLPKKVVYRNRRKKKVYTRMEYRYRQGRTYADFTAFMEMYPNTPVIEMDTVKSARGCTKALLTLIFPESNFMLVFLMTRATEKCVLSVFDYLTRLLGVDTFHKLFPVILTDNGVEFKDPDALEFSENGCRRTNIFYCDPMASWQKPHVEKNHVLIRRFLPKGTSFVTFTQNDIHLMVCHLNSYSRELLKNKTPFALMKSKEQKKLLELLKLSPVPPDEVMLSPALFKH